MPTRKRKLSFINQDNDFVIPPPTKRERELEDAKSRGYTMGYAAGVENERVKYAAQTNTVKLDLVKQLTEIMRTNAQLASSAGILLDNLGAVHG